MKQRLTLIKRATVRILTNGKVSGTGFVISKDGLIATCFHVVQHIQPAPNGQTQIGYAKSIEIEFNDENKLSATVHKSCQKESFFEAFSKDYCILEVKTKNLAPLPLGIFANAYEGASIYLCGYPLGINQPVVSVGILSTKWSTSGYLNQGNTREVAWLDVTMNKGNSGGPIVLTSKEPEDDKVIGIASFSLNPFARPAGEFIEIVQTFPGYAALMGVDFRRFATLIGDALSSNSLGVSGCVSIDYLRSNLNRVESMSNSN